jgi:hypothetical protein
MEQRGGRARYLVIVIWLLIVAADDHRGQEPEPGPPLLKQHEPVGLEYAIPNFKYTPCVASSTAGGPSPSPAMPPLFPYRPTGPVGDSLVIHLPPRLP